ncbi:MAG: TetR/AcrR family transcriptional regulator [Muribaculaceae bacterium]|nr:TetR/AcrR family transcriptional regulator [Muribaculaceae bacterium]
MTKEEMTREDYNALVNSILSIMMKKGISSTTMDQLATKLRISKRTLYEIFISKELLVGEILKVYIDLVWGNQIKIAEKSANIIETLIKIFIYSRNLLSEINLDFYRDMEAHFLMQKDYEETAISYNIHMLELIKEGIKKGLIRNDIDYFIMYRLMLVQMNFLKRMDETFPPDISMYDVYNTIFLGFMRGIVSPQGMSVLDNCLRDYPDLTKKSIIE